MKAGGSLSHLAIMGTNQVLIGKRRGMTFAVCLKCGKLLGVSKRVRLLEKIEKLHECSVSFVQP